MLIGVDRNVHNSPDNLYTEADHLSSYSRIEAIDYHTTLTHAGISITPYHAGHVLGGAMFFIEIAGLKILFTGDYSREDDRHLVSAEVPHQKPDLLICESTYGTATHMPRLEKEARLMKMTTEILNRGGRVLMPVFALGRAQELLLILDEYWEKHPAYQSYPIYYASNLARKCMDVYRTYINTMNDKIKRAMFEGEGRNPWDFRWVRSLKTIDRFEDVGGCVMLASPGMLQVKLFPCRAFLPGFPDLPKTVWSCYPHYLLGKQSIWEGRNTFLGHLVDYIHFVLGNFHRSARDHITSCFIINIVLPTSLSSSPLFAPTSIDTFHEPR